MANFQNLKKRKRLGTPPPPEMAGDNLSAPETAPHSPLQQPKKSKKTSDEHRHLHFVLSKETQEKKPRPKRQTGRTEPFATRVSPEFKYRLKMISARDKLKLVEVLEKAIEAYEREREGN